MKHKTLSNKEWTLTVWPFDGTDSLQCYAKRFGRGIVYVGVGSFDTVCYHYGSNSERSMSSTRWLNGRPNGRLISEKDMMEHIDNFNGLHSRYVEDQKD